MAKKVRYYTDPLQEDFAPTKDKIHVNPIDQTYRYEHGPIWKCFEFLLYRLFATPVVWLLMKLLFGLKIKGKKNIRSLKGGYVLYGNHTSSMADAYIPTLVSFPKKARIIVGDATVSIPEIKTIVAMLGAVPLPGNLAGMRNMLSACSDFTKHQTVTIYPEAHIWPFYNGIRPYSDASFQYPFILKCPAVGMVVTYRQRRIFKNLPPLITVSIGTPIDPVQCKNRKELRDQIYNWMCETVKAEKSYAHIDYIQVEKSEDDDSLAKKEETA